MQIGIIRKNARGVFTGSISTLDLGVVMVALRGVMQNPNKPDLPAFEVMAYRPGQSFQNAVKLGALWEKTYRDGSGQVFLQGQLNDPSFPKPLRVACFTISDGEEKGNLSVVWDDGKRRNRQTEDAKEETADHGDGLGTSTAGDGFGWNGQNQNQDDYDYQP